MPDYLDTSAFIKLVRSEPESVALRADIGYESALVSSALLLVEGRRAAARYGSLARSRARAALTTITLLPLDDATLERAAGLEPVELRSLDALHLAAALSLGEDLRRFYCYDDRLVGAGAALGLAVRRPG
ncbi:MAG: PIN domain-containing protein [Solirubrobacteraceae bacterium]